MDLGYGLPCLRSTSKRVRCFFARRAVRTRTHNASGSGHRLPATPDFFFSRRNEALPGCWVILVTRAASQTPRRMYVALAMTIDVLLPSGPMEPWASGTRSIFGATTPRLMYLHASASPTPSPVIVARLASE